MSNKISRNINNVKVTFNKTRPLTKESVILMQNKIQMLQGVSVSFTKKIYIINIDSTRRKSYPLRTNYRKHEPFRSKLWDALAQNILSNKVTPLPSIKYQTKPPLIRIKRWTNCKIWRIHVKRKTSRKPKMQHFELRNVNW